MKASLQKLFIPLLTLCALLGGVARSHAQEVLVTVDPAQNWIGYMNVFNLPANGGGYVFGNPWGAGDLRAAFSGGTQLTLSPNTNVWETTDTFYVQGDGVTPNVNMDASFYVENDALANTNVVFIGQCLSNSLAAAPEPLTGVSYTTTAFIKIFDGGYGLIGSATTNLVAGQAFSLSLNTTGAAHIQYGFETLGPDANPSTASALGNVVVATAPTSATVTVDPSQNWVGYMNVFELPVNGSGYIYGSQWGIGDLQAAFTGTTALTLSPNTNVWETTDTFYVQGDGVTPNKSMDASFYVQNDSLINSNVVFVGTCISDTLTASPEPLTGVPYTSVAFIKAFNSSFGIIASVSSPVLATGQSFGLSLNTAGAAHVQYGFETIGPDVNPSTAANLGTVVLAPEVPPSPLLVPTNAAPVPTRPASSVLSLYNSSGTYTNHPVERWLSGWSAASEGSFPIAATGHSVLKYSTLQYAGVEFYNNDATLGAGGDNVGGATNFAANVSAYDTMHIDVWTPNANQFGVQLVSLNPTAAAEVDFLPDSGTITNNGWVSLDIPLSTFTAINPGTDLTDLQQMLWIDNQAGGFIGGIFYIDNVYFYNSTVAGAPTITASVSGGGISLAFPTQGGSTYTIQYKTNLTDAVWQTLSDVSGNGSVQSATDPATQKSRFYRVYVH